MDHEIDNSGAIKLVLSCMGIATILFGMVLIYTGDAPYRPGIIALGFGIYVFGISQSPQFLLQKIGRGSTEIRHQKKRTSVILELIGSMIVIGGLLIEFL